MGGRCEQTSEQTDEPTIVGFHCRWNQSEQMAAWQAQGEFPCIVKAADLDDSRGLSLVHHKAQLEPAVNKCFSAGAGSVIVEK